jgi:hypothetical protein
MKYRVYFNRAEDAPQVWSIDEGSHSSEINVQAVVAFTTADSNYNLSAVYPEPKAWFEYEGTLEIKSGIAYIHPPEV